MLSQENAVPRQLVPMIHVTDVAESSSFYAKLGFYVERAFTPPDTEVPSWMWLSSFGAHLMLVRASAPVVAEQQAVLFYLYVKDLTGAHHRATACGLAPGEISHPPHSPGGEFRLTDPTGYAFMVRGPLA